MDEKKSRRMARAICADIMIYHNDLLQEAVRTGRRSPELTAALDEGRQEYLSRQGAPEIFEQEIGILLLTGQLDQR